MLRDTHSDLLLEVPSPSPSALRPGVHVCPWGAPDGGAEVVLVGHNRRRLAQTFCTVEQVEEVTANFETLWRILEPPPEPLKLMA